MYISFYKGGKAETVFEIWSVSLGNGILTIEFDNEVQLAAFTAEFECTTLYYLTVYLPNPAEGFILTPY